MGGLAIPLLFTWCSFFCVCPCIVNTLKFLTPGRVSRMRTEARKEHAGGSSVMRLLFWGGGWELFIVNVLT